MKKHSLLALAPGEIKEIQIAITETGNAQEITTPITVLRGKKSGPKVFLTATLHGNELNGLAVLRAFLNKVKINNIKGTIVVCPIVNMLGFLGRSRDLPDGRDLNRYFPGSKTGSMAGRIAHRFFHEVIKPCDFGVDFHTGASGRENFPHVRGDLSKPAIRKMARAFGLPIVVDKAGSKGTLRQEASKQKIPTILIEAGRPDMFQKQVVQATLRGLFHFLQKMGSLEKNPMKAPLPLNAIIKKTKWIRAERGGLLELKVAPGKLVEKGDTIANITSPFGKDVVSVKSPFSGLVLCQTYDPLLSPGMPIVHLAFTQKTLPALRKHLKNGKLAL